MSGMADARTPPRRRPRRRGPRPLGRSPAAGPTERGRRARSARRASHSLESVVSEAVALLDEAGESALTFRALAARLGGGVGSIYWYVSGKERARRPRRRPRHRLGARGHRGPDPRRGPPTTTCGPRGGLLRRRRRPPLAGGAVPGQHRAAAERHAPVRTLGQQVMRLGAAAAELRGRLSRRARLRRGTAADLGRQPPPTVPKGQRARGARRALAGPGRGAVPLRPLRLDEFATHDDGEQVPRRAGPPPVRVAAARPAAEARG